MKTLHQRLRSLLIDLDEISATAIHSSDIGERLRAREALKNIFVLSRSLHSLACLIASEPEEGN